MYVVGCTSMYLMSAISIERYYVIQKPMNIKKVSFTAVYFVVFVCLCLGLFWSVAPLIGWSHYSFEGVKTSCAIEWNEGNLNVFSYNMTILVFVFFIPLIGIILAHYKILIVVSKNALKLKLISAAVELGIDPRGSVKKIDSSGWRPAFVS